MGPLSSFGGNREKSGSHSELSLPRNGGNLELPAAILVRGLRRRTIFLRYLGRVFPGERNLISHYHLPNIAAFNIPARLIPSILRPAVARFTPMPPF